MDYMPSSSARSVTDHVGDLVRARREELGLNRSEAAARSGVSLQSWVDVETGVERKRGYTAQILRPMAEALRWPPTFLDDLRDGHVPTAVMSHGVDHGEIEAAQQMGALIVTLLTRIAALEARLEALEAPPASRRRRGSSSR
jgi:transcriptional regulator with XRE-family HTH domain